jgi:hypothetical protein
LRRARAPDALRQVLLFQREAELVRPRVGQVAQALDEPENEEDRGVEP